MLRSKIPVVSNIRHTILGLEVYDRGYELWINFADNIRPKACEFVKWFFEREIRKHHDHPFVTHYHRTGTETVFDPKIPVNRIKSFKSIGNIAHIDYDPVGPDDPFPIFLETLRSEAKRLHYEIGSLYK